MKYPVYTEELINKTEFKTGECKYKIEKIEPKISKNENQMIEIKLEITDCSGANLTAYDYITFTSTMAWKLKHFVESLGFIYTYGEIDTAEVINKKGRCVTMYEESDYKGQKYKKLKIKDYIPAQIQEELFSTQITLANENELNKTNNSTDFKDDIDIPF